ncbi:hypothetical protein ACFQ48_07265 [Hymenobacter caeli]|uniref:Lipoprotein n=1 Tax=Hymenobacter caeli TaxID=2735894 RepID=A0ABX2FM03_9BACT|nr:hypothetical protein [Hymenobacter caeli]NRT18041.1 hypothetical protein [Hymenobacter caeli]
MTTLLRPFLLATAVAAGLGLSACSDSHKYGSTNVEDGSNKHIDGEQNNVGGDSAVAGLRRPGTGTPSQEQGYDSADVRTDRNHDGKSDK